MQKKINDVQLLFFFFFQLHNSHFLGSVVEIKTKLPRFAGTGSPETRVLSALHYFLPLGYTRDLGLFALH